VHTLLEHVLVDQKLMRLVDIRTVGEGLALLTYQPG
jgi:hypothetical protein